MRKIRVLEMGMDRNIGGIETYLFHQLEQADHNAIHFDFLQENVDHLAFSEELVRNGASIIVMIAKASKNPKSYCAEFKKILENGHYDAIIMNSGSYCRRHLLLFKVAKEAKIPIRIFHAHGSKQQKSIGFFIGYFFMRPVLAGNSSNLLTHRWACSLAGGKYYFGNQSFEWIHNGINTQEFSFIPQQRIRMRKELNLDPDVLVLGTVGRISDEKNQSFLVPVLSECIQRKMNVRLVFVGAIIEGNSEGEKLEQTIQDLNMHSFVLQLGLRSDVSNIMMAMDVFLLPSLYEGFPLTGVEAQCSGLPCILSEGVPRETKLADNVEFVPIDQGPQPWVDAIKRAKILDRREAGSEVVKKAGFDVSQQVGMVQSLLTKYLEESGKV
jgi:glycosyltransferase involved in cell wall biosynthesis